MVRRVRRVHGPRARARSRDASSTSDERRATNDARRWNAFARGTGRTDGRTGRTMTDGRSRRGSFHSFTSSRDDSIHMHSRAIRDARARCVCVHPCIHANARVSRVVFFFSRRVRASIGRTRRRARREVVESTPRVFAFNTHSNECLRHRRHISTRCVDANAWKRREKNSDDDFARVCVHRRRRIARAGTMDDAMIARATPRSIHLPEETTTSSRARRRRARRPIDRFARRESISSSPRACSRGRRRARCDEDSRARRRMRARATPR